MRFIFLNQYYPPDTAPTGQYAHDLARELASRGHAVTAVCSRRPYNGDALYERESVLDGVRVIRVRATGFGRRSPTGKILDYASFWAALAAQLMRSGKGVDAVLSLTTPPYVGLLGRWAARRHRAAHLHWVMDIYPDVLVAHGGLTDGSLLHRRLAALTRTGLRGSPLVACLGEDMADRLRRYAPETDAVHAVPLWSDPALAPWAGRDPPALRAEQGWGGDDLVLMYSGNMGRGHRLGEFLAGARALSGDSSVKWVFAGGGKRREEVERARAEMPDAPIALLPYAPADRLREHLCAADIHLASLDSRWQGCMVPSKIQGIFAVGKPLLFVGGEQNEPARWIRESGAGWVVPENDGAALRAAVESARDPAERARRGSAARRFAERHFDKAANLARLCSLIETAAAR